jgi:hypothetical protein
MSDRDTEVMLIERLRAQDTSVLETLMERYSPRVKSRLHRARIALREVLTRRLGRGGHA